MSNPVDRFSDIAGNYARYRPTYPKNLYAFIDAHVTERKRLELSPFGNRLLRNDADWLEPNRIQRWVGGVYVDSRGAGHWRWDAAADNVLEVRR